MPLRDPDTGKELSGAQRRKLRAARDAPDKTPAKAAKKKAAKKKALVVPAAAEDAVELDPVLSPFEKLADPPEDTAQLIRWSAQLHALAVSHIARNPRIYPNQREWLRALLGGTTQLGILRDKAAEQQKIDEALRREEQASKKQGLTSAHGRKAPQVTRPPG